ncbi:MAG: CDGSH iron-sulfur domain-containing protein [Planctomycetota bacterium]
MSAKPRVAGAEPVEVELAARNHAWCACGLSRAQPMCDGSHGGCGLRPVVFRPEAARPAWLCMCKQTRTPPYCDGSHRSLPAPGSQAG